MGHGASHHHPSSPKPIFFGAITETKRYEIGPALWFAGATYMANHRVLRAAMPYLQKPEQIEGIAVQLAERVRDQAVAIYSAQPYATEIAKAQYGYHFPLHCGSKGRVLLAFEDAGLRRAVFCGGRSKS